MRRAPLLLAAALVALLVAANVVAGRVVHLACHDGDPQVLLEGRSIPSDEATCDAVADGVCAFIVRVSVGPCGCAYEGCCQTTVSAAVPVKRKKRVRRRGFPSLVLSCRPPIQRACTDDIECHAHNPCVGSCGFGRCQPGCVCITPDFAETCSPERAIHCPSTDCHSVIGDLCRHCDENGLCVTNGFCG